MPTCASQRGAEKLASQSQPFSLQYATSSFAMPPECSEMFLELQCQPKAFLFCIQQAELWEKIGLADCRFLLSLCIPSTCPLVGTQ